MVTLKRDKKARDCWLITTPDGEANRQQRIMFDDFDRDVADMEVEQSDDLNERKEADDDT